ncbi:MAG: hypothetical protein Q7K40_01195, partial [bacterium]|nr:hypothetical protein [bacterium]
MNYQKGFIAPLLIALITILLIGGGAYVYVQNKQANQSVVEGNTQVSSTGTAFAIPIQGDVKTITEDFIPFTFNESQFQQLPDAIVIKLKGENSPAIVKDISLTKDNWHAPVLYLPLKIGNGLYDVEVFAAEYDMDRNNLTPLYKTKISVERKITDNTLVSVEQKYPAQKDSWEGINVQPLTVGGETNFLKFEISNKTNSVMHIQAFEMGTEAGGRAGFIKSFSIYDVSSGKKLSTLSDLFQTSGTIVNYNLYYLNTAVEIPPGKSLQTELRGVIIPELLPSTFKSKPAFFFYQVFVEVGGDVVRKEVYMTPRAVIEQSAQATSSPQTSDAIVFVPGMSQYTDAGFGFSFWYPSEWVVKQIPTGNTFTSYPGGTVSKALSVSPANSSIEGSIMIKEFSSPTKSITDPVLGCPMGNCTDTVRYYFDTLAHTWMLERPDGIHSLDGTRTTVPVAPANV